MIDKSTGTQVTLSAGKIKALVLLISLGCSSGQSLASDIFPFFNHKKNNTYLNNVKSNAAAVHQVEHLPYGDSIYKALTQDPLAALLPLEVALERGHLQQNAESSNLYPLLFRSELQYHYGLYKPAVDFLQSLSSQNINQMQLDEVRFRLGELYYKGRAYQKSQEVLSVINPQYPDYHQVQYWLHDMALDQGRMIRFDEPSKHAVDQISMAYLTYKQLLSQAASSPQDWQNLITQVQNIEKKNPAAFVPGFLDRLRLSAALKSMHSNNTQTYNADALLSLPSITPASPWHSQASLLMAMTQITPTNKAHGSDNYWQNYLQLRDDIATNVLSPADAYKAMRQLSQTLQADLSHLQEQIEPAAFSDWFGKNKDWLMPIDQTKPAHAQGQLWLQWFIDSDHQALLKAYGSAVQVEQSLEQWSEKWPFLDMTLTEQATVYQQRVQGLVDSKTGEDFKQLSAEYQKLSDKLAQIKPDQFNPELLTASQKKLFTLVQANIKRVEKLARAGLITPTQANKHRQTLARAHGVLIWQAAMDWPEQYYQVSKGLKDSQAALIETEQRLQRLSRLSNEWQGEQQRQQLNAAKTRLQQLSAKAAAYKETAVAALQNSAKEYLSHLVQQHTHLYQQVLHHQLQLGLALYTSEQAVDGDDFTALRQDLIEDLETYLTLESLNHDEKNQALLALGNLYYEQGEVNETAYQAAVNAYTTWLAAKNPDSDDQIILQQVHYRLAELYALMTRQADSVAHLQILFNTKGPYFAEAAFRLGEDAYAKGQFEQAAVYYRAQLTQAQAADGDEKTRYMLGWAMYKAGDLKAALDEYLGLLLEQKAEPELTTTTSTTAAAQSLYQDAQRIAKIAIEQMGGAEGLINHFPSPLSDQGRLAFDLRLQDLQDKALYFKWYEASERFQQAYPDDKASPELAIKTVNLFTQQQFFKQVREQQERFIERYADQPQWHGQVINYAVALGDYHRGLALASLSSTSRQPSNTAARTSLERALGFYQIAELYFSSDVIPEQGDGEAKPLTAITLDERIGDSFFDLKNYANAAAYYEKIAYPAQSPDSPLTQENLLEPVRLKAALAHIASLQNMKDISPSKFQSARLRFLNTYGDLPQAQPDALQLRLATAYYALDNNDNLQTLELIQPLYTKITTTKNPAISLADQLKVIDLYSSGHYNQKNYGQAASAYELGLGLVQTPGPSASSYRIKWAQAFGDSLFLHAKAQVEQEQLEPAIATYQRLVELAPRHNLAPAALFDYGVNAAALERLPDAIQVWQQLTTGYPDSELVGKAYLKIAQAHQDQQQFAQAAKALVVYRDQYHDRDTSQKLSKQDLTLTIAGLYEQGKNPQAAIQAYEVLANDQTLQQADWFQSVGRLIVLSQQPEALKWRQRLVNDFKTKVQNLNGESQTLVLQSGAVLAQEAHATFAELTIDEPIQQSLAVKQKALETAINGYQQLIDWSISPYYEQGLLGLGQLYVEFAKALMASERPTGLSDLAQEEYDILLEEQAFPFEEKGIEYHEANLKRLWAGEKNAYTLESLKRLQQLMSSQYARPERIEESYREPH